MKNVTLIVLTALSIFAGLATQAFAGTASDGVVTVSAPDAAAVAGCA